MPQPRQTLSDQLHDEILEMIINAGPASDRMSLVERELVEKFQVSKAPVREALLKLCNEGVLRSIPRCGYVVVQLGEKSDRDNRIVRAMLETTTLSSYFDLFTEEHLQRIRDQIRRARETTQSSDNIWKIWKSNSEFHIALISVANNPCLERHLKECLAVEQRSFAQNSWKGDQDFNTFFIPEAHEDIFYAIETKQKERALRLLKQDILTQPGADVLSPFL